MEKILNPGQAITIEIMTTSLAQLVQMNITFVNRHNLGCLAGILNFI